MLKRLGRALMWGVGAYVAGVIIGIVLVAALSMNTHDKNQEVVMTAFFFVGPIVGVIGLVIALVWPRRH
jgi:F0F1-type ATP synthase membrane subunit c/vacuolar-type H+-ATPase subunit K